MKKEVILRPEIQEIFDRLPKLIRVIESQVKDDIQTDLQRISDQIARKPDERELIIKKHREIADNRYNELINSGLRITATDEERAFNLIRLYIIAKDTWKIPMPKDCSFQSIEPQPYGHIRTAIYPVYYQYNLIQACNDMLNKQGGTQPEGTGIACIYNEQQLKQIFLKLHEANYLSGRQSDFVNGFQPGALPSGWQQIEWKLNNSELSVLVYRLTGKKRPVPAQVGKIFKTNKKFKSVAGGRGEAVGGEVYNLLKSLL